MDELYHFAERMFRLIGSFDRDKNRDRGQDDTVTQIQTRRFEKK